MLIEQGLFSTLHNQFIPSLKRQKFSVTLPSAKDKQAPVIAVRKQLTEKRPPTPFTVHRPSSVTA